MHTGSYASELKNVPLFSTGSEKKSVFYPYGKLGRINKNEKNYGKYPAGNHTPLYTGQTPRNILIKNLNINYLF